jgi:hypothetical protein
MVCHYNKIALLRQVLGAFHAEPEEKFKKYNKKCPQ